jgi:SAM-dependent methyltransferase
MRWAWVFVLVGCAATRSHPPSIETLSRGWLRASDEADAATAERLLAPAFVRMEAGRSFDRARVLERLAARAAGSGFPRSTKREYEGEKVRVIGDVAIYTTFTRVKWLRAEGAAPIVLDRQVTLVWVREGGRWQLAHQQVADSGVDAERQVWNEVFRMQSGYETQPNRLLVETVRGRPAGRALDIGMGQGRNAIWLAANGWSVTGVDISDEALRQARETASAEGLELTLVQQDVATFDLGEEQWDLICFIYAGGREEVERVRRGLRPGGLVIIEWFHDDAVKDIGLPGFKTNELPELYREGFEVLRYEEVEDKPDWGPAQTKLVRFVAKKL